MIEIRFHGRGGQGAVTAARMLAEAAFREGYYCQAFPFFGAERRGAPVTAFVRVDRRPIRTRTQVYEPDHVVVLDSSLIPSVDVAAGLKPGGVVLIDAKSVPPGLGKGRIVPVDAAAIASEALGAPITNTAMLGAFAKAVGLVSLDSILAVVRDHFKGTLAEKNADAARKAHELA